MANDTGKLLKEISSLSGNMDILFQELKEQNKNNADTTKGLKDLATSIKDSNKSGDIEQTFKSFTDSFTKAFSEQNKQLVSSLSEKITQSFTGSVSDFLSNVPNQIAQVKSGNSPDFKSLLGGNTIKNLVQTTTSKIPGLAEGGTVEKNGIAVVGEKGPELVQLSAKSSIMNNDAYEEAENALLNTKVSKDSDLLQKVQEAMKTIYGEDGVDEGSDAQPVDKFVTWLNSEYGKDELNEIKSDPDLILDEYSVFKDFVRDQKMREASKKAFEERQREVAALKEESKKEASVETSMQTLAEKKEAEGKVPLSPESSNTTQVQKKQDLSSLITSNNSGASAIEALNKRLLDSTSVENRKKIEDAKNAASMVKETSTLKDKPAQTSPPATPPASEKSQDKPQENKNLQENLASQVKAVKEATGMAQSTKSSSEKTTSTGDQLNPKDISDIKGLLAGIYNALKSPLTISNDYPFRPNSNTF